MYYKIHQFHLLITSKSDMFSALSGPSGNVYIHFEQNDMRKSKSSVVIYVRTKTGILLQHCFYVPALYFDIIKR